MGGSDYPTVDCHSKKKETNKSPGDDVMATTLHGRRCDGDVASGCFLATDWLV